MQSHMHTVFLVYTVYTKHFKMWSLLQFWPQFNCYYNKVQMKQVYKRLNNENNYELKNLSDYISSW